MLSLFDFLLFFKAKPVQKWWDYDGIGRYQSRYHKFPVNMMLRDTQNRRVFEKYNQERVLVNTIWKNDILPKELQDYAKDQVRSSKASQCSQST